MKVVIMAGGRGTRISSVASDIPKPMIKIEGKPVLEHEIECLRDQGFRCIKGNPSERKRGQDGYRISSR